MALGLMDMGHDVHDLATRALHLETQPTDRLREIERLAPGGIQRASAHFGDSSLLR